MTPTEEMAEAMLTKLGWKPRKKGSGYLDFECVDDKHVEVKRIAMGYCGLRASQLRMIQDETAFGLSKTFLMVFSEKEEYVGMFEIKAVDYPLCGISIMNKKEGDIN